jgi:hypothetical protein
VEQSTRRARYFRGFRPRARPGQHLGTQTLFTGRAGADEATGNHDEVAYDRTATYKNTIDKPRDQFSVAFLPTEN